MSRYDERKRFNFNLIKTGTTCKVNALAGMVLWRATIMKYQQRLVHNAVFGKPVDEFKKRYSMKDSLYRYSPGPNGADSHEPYLQILAPFEFNQEVAEVFQDMISRSVPGYHTSIELAVVLAAEFCKSNDLVYDLGCSLGAATFALAHQKSLPRLRISAVDLSKPMLDRFAQMLAEPNTESLNNSFPMSFNEYGAQRHEIHLIHDDVLQIQMLPSKLILLNYVLQFIAVEHRDELLASLYDSLKPGGVLLLSEKIITENQQKHERLEQLHLGFKRLQGYSELEIHGKRTALEQVLIPESIKVHQERLKKIGFREISVVAQHLNFVSILAFK